MVSRVTYKECGGAYSRAGDYRFSLHDGHVILACAHCAEYKYSWQVVIKEPLTLGEVISCSCGAKFNVVQGKVIPAKGADSEIDLRIL